MSFRCTLSHFIAMYRNSLCRYCRLWSLFESPQPKNRFFEAKRLCQRMLYAFRSDAFKIVTRKWT